MLKQGRVTPQVWMQGAVGKNISIEHTLKAAQEAVAYFKQK